MSQIPCVFVSKDSFRKLIKNVGIIIELNEKGEVSLFSFKIYQPNDILLIPFIFFCCCFISFLFRQIKVRYDIFTRNRIASNLPVGKYEIIRDTINNTGCCICLEEFINNDVIKLLPCGHGFHRSCIDQWLFNNSNQCPVCRRSIFINSENFFTDSSLVHIHFSYCIETCFYNPNNYYIIDSQQIAITFD